MTQLPGIGVQQIRTARERLASTRMVRWTPLIHDDDLSKRCRTDVWLKLESLQHTGSFKLRGALAYLLALGPEDGKQGVVAASTGNHGRALAYAAQQLQLATTICLSSLVPESKKQAIRDLGAKLVVAGDSQDEAEIEAERLARDEEAVLVPPFDHPQVIAGQGAIGLEIAEDLPATRTVVAGLSGGGLISGIAIALKSTQPNLRVVGVSSERCPAMQMSQQAGHPVQVEERSSLADSLGGGIGMDNQYTFRIVRDFVNDLVLVTEDEIAAAMTHLFEKIGVVAEGAAAAPVAALLAGRVDLKGPVVMVISGRNADARTINRALEMSSSSERIPSSLCHRDEVPPLTDTEQRLVQELTHETDIAERYRRNNG